MTTSQAECVKFNQWMQYIHKDKLKKTKPQKQITEPKDFREWLIYIQQQRNSPYRRGL